MKVFVFNPEHDMALADNKPSFLPPKIIRAMAKDLSVLPMWLAHAGDVVIVDSVEEAERFRSYIYNKVENDDLRDIGFASFAESFDDMCKRLSINALDVEFEPWGWDCYIKRRLLQWGVPETLLPTEGKMNEIRNLSSRQTAVELLPEFVKTMPAVFGGASRCLRDVFEMNTMFKTWNNVILKAPWSSSGKGLRLCYDSNITDSTLGWLKKTIASQGCCIVEPLYQKLADLAMEFSIYNKVYFIGYSKFDTLMQGSYQGNKLLTDAEIEQFICRELNISIECLQQIRNIVACGLEKTIVCKYQGNLGIDMMICADEKTGKKWLHPCVEVNLRNNMGILAHELKNRWFANRSSFAIHFGSFEPCDSALDYVPLVPELSDNKYTARAY